jgi:sulfite reductase alpha subunit-like flavoprotein
MVGNVLRLVMVFHSKERIMKKTLTDGAGDSMIYTAKLQSSERITPATSREEVKRLVLRTDNLFFDSKVGSCIRVLAPGQYGNPYHTRLYSIADTEQMNDGARFEICVRRCSFIDEASGEESAGVASNYLCDLKPGCEIKFSGPVGYPFVVPDDTKANLLMIGMGTGIAPFRGVIRMIYDKHAGWKGKVRLFHGARSGLESIYMNDTNNDIGNYFDQPTFKAFQAVSPRPAFNEPAELDKAIEQHAAEVWEMVNSPGSRVYVAGMSQMTEMIGKAMVKTAGSPEAWTAKRNELVAAGRWVEVLY